MIVTPPAGTEKYYNRSSSFYVLDWDGIYYGEREDVTRMVFTDNGEVYIQNPVSLVNNDIWVKGTLSDDGNTVVVEPGQILYYDQWFGSYMVLSMARVITHDDGTLEVVEDDSTPIIYTVDGDNIKLDNATLGEYGLGAFWKEGANDGMWADYVDFTSVFTPMDVTVNTMPEGLDVMLYGMTYDLGYWDIEAYGGRMINVAFDGNDVYFEGLSPKNPQAVVKGTLDGNVLTIPSGQFIGVSYGYMVWFMGGEVVTITQDWGSYEGYEFTDALVLDYDPETGVFTCPGQGYLLSISQETVSYLDAYKRLNFAPYHEVPATPANPVFRSYADFFEWEGDVSLMYHIPPFDLDGNFLNPENLYYTVYYDNDVPYTFTAEEYDFDEDMTEIPYNFNDAENNWISAHGVTIYVKKNDMYRIGLQSIYRVNGVENRSDIVYYELSNTGVEEINDIDVQHDGPIYDLSGRQIEKPTRGFYIQNGHKYLVK